MALQSLGMNVDITSDHQVAESCKEILSKFGRIDVLINNVANDPKVTVEENGNNLF